MALIASFLKVVKLRFHTELIYVIFFSIMTFLSLCYYKERSIFLDISFHLFEILRNGNYAIQNFRIGAIFTQSFPVLMSKMGFSLKMITICYSYSFVLIHIIMVAIILFWIKNKKVGFLYILFLTLISTHTFFWIQSELPQGISFLFLLMALIESKLNYKIGNMIFFCLAIPLILIISFSHYLSVIPFIYILVYLFLSHRSQFIFFAALGANYAIFVLIKIVFFSNTYDQNALEGLANFINLFPNYFNQPSNKKFLIYLIRDYYMFVILFILVIIDLYRTKKIWQLWLMVTFIMGYAFLLNICYPNGAEQFYIENQYLIISMIVGIPFVFDTCQHRIRFLDFFILISLVFFTIRVIKTSTEYTERLDWYRTIHSQSTSLDNKKMIIPKNKVPIDLLKMTWASSYESWLLSTIELNESRSLIIEENNNEFDNILSKNDHFITRWGIFPYSALDTNYFIFRDLKPYIKITSVYED